LHLHDPDCHPDHLDQAKKNAIKAMIKLKEQKLVKTLGCGMNQNEMLSDLAKEGCFDCFLLAGRYTLIDQTSLDQLIPICEEYNISLLLGGVFNSGILINPGPDSHFDYSKLDENWSQNLKDSLVRIPKDHESADFWLEKAYTLKHACEKFNTTLRKAAIQFPFANSVVGNCILGMTSPSQVEENVNDYENKLPNDFWSYLRSNKLINEKAPIA
jgi:D-threo-aldose 1-dehydrogenase